MPPGFYPELYGNVEGVTVVQAYTIQTFTVAYISLLTSDTPKDVSIRVDPDNPKQGEMITITCNATAKPAVNNYNFYRNDTFLGSSGNGKVMVNATDCKQFTGIYKCSATNTMGVSANATKSVAVKGQLSTFLSTIITYLFFYV